MEKVDLVKLAAEHPLLKGTFIEELFQAMADQKFVEPSEPIELGEAAVGEMTEMEKALGGIQTACGKEEKALIDHFRSSHPQFNNRKVVAIELDQIHTRLKIAKYLFRYSITKRLAEAYQKPGVKGFGIRQGFKIVSIPESGKECFICGEDHDTPPMGSLLGDLAILSLLGRLEGLGGRR